MGDVAVRGLDSPKRIHHNRHCAFLVATKSPKCPLKWRARFNLTSAVSMVIPKNGRDLNQAVSSNIVQENHLDEVRATQGLAMSRTEEPWVAPIVKPFFLACSERARVRCRSLIV